MKAVHVAWLALVPLIGTLLVEIGKILQGPEGHGDWNAVIAAISGILAVFLPAAQLALPWFHYPSTKGEMPVLSSERQ